MAEVRLEIDLAHPSEQVWRALTDPRALSEWFMPTDLDPRAGARFTLEPGTRPGFLGPVTGEVVEVTPPGRLVMLWQGEKLHTRVVWELVGTDEGCRLQLLQTGFIGAPAALRGRALRSTYRELFGERLPRALDRLAAGATGGAFMPAQRPVPEAHRPVPDPLPRAGVARTVVPRQRRANAPTAAWSAGRALGPPAGSGSPAEPAPPVALDAAGAAAPAPALRPGAPTAAGPAGPVRVPLRRLWDGPPGWLRAVVVGSAAAAAATLVLGTVLYAGGPGIRERAADGEGSNELGVAVQPGTVTPAPDLMADSGPAAVAPDASPAASGGSAASRGPMAPDAGGADPGEQDATDPPGTGTSTPGNPPPGSPAPELTAQLTTSGLPLLGGRAVQATVSNPGPGSADSWELVIEVEELNVTNVTGATYHRGGADAVFTPEDGPLTEGGSTEINFNLEAPVLGLLGVHDPTGCTIDGRPCD